MRHLLMALVILAMGSQVATAQQYRPYLGIRIQKVTTEVAGKFGLQEPHGALVVVIDEHGPAQSSSIVLGDLIVKVEGKDVADFSEVSRAVASSTVGKEFSLTVIRMGIEKPISIRLGRIAVPKMPTCEEFAPLAEGIFTQERVEQLFGKPFREMNFAEADQAAATVALCQKEVRTWPQHGFGRRFTPGILYAVDQYVQGARSRQLDQERQLAARNATAIKVRLEAEQKTTECRLHCKDRLEALIADLPNSVDSQRLREVRRQYDALVSTVPDDMQNSLAPLEGAFSTKYQEIDATVREHERVREQEKMATQTKTTQTQELSLLYLAYLELKFCSQRYPNFQEATDTAKEAAKNKEAQFSSDDVDAIWGRVAQAFTKMEPMLRATSELYVECNGASNTLAGLLMSGIGQSRQAPALPKKDF